MGDKSCGLHSVALTLAVHHRQLVGSDPEPKKLDCPGKTVDAAAGHHSLLSSRSYQIFFHHRPGKIFISALTVPIGTNDKMSAFSL